MLSDKILLNIALSIIVLYTVYGLKRLIDKTKEE